MQEKKPDAGREMFIRETGSTGSSSTGALVAINSLQPFFISSIQQQAAIVFGVPPNF
jgi:hypothetical protein